MRKARLADGQMVVSRARPIATAYQPPPRRADNLQLGRRVKRQERTNLPNNGGARIQQMLPIHVSRSYKRTVAARKKPEPMPK